METQDVLGIKLIKDEAVPEGCVLFKDTRGGVTMQHVETGMSVHIPLRELSRRVREVVQGTERRTQ